MNYPLLLPASFFASCAASLIKTVFPGWGRELIHEPDLEVRKCLGMESCLHVPAYCPFRLLAELLGEGQQESYRTSEVEGSGVRAASPATPEAGTVALLNTPTPQLPED